MDHLVILNRDDLRELLREMIPDISHSKEKQENMLTTEEACRFAKVSRPTLHRWKKAGLIPYVKIGKNVRYKQCDLIEALNKSRVNKKEEIV